MDEDEFVKIVKLFLVIVGVLLLALIVWGITWMVIVTPSA